MNHEVEGADVLFCACVCVCVCVYCGAMAVVFRSHVPRERMRQHSNIHIHTNVGFPSCLTNLGVFDPATCLRWSFCRTSSCISTSELSVFFCWRVILDALNCVDVGMLRLRSLFSDKEPHG